MKSWVLYSAPVKYLIYYPLFFIGYFIFKKTQKTPWLSFFSFRKLFCLTRGELNKEMSQKVSTHTGSYPLSHEPEGVLNSGENFTEQMENALSHLEKDGYHIFPQKLPLDKIQALTQIAKTTQAQLIPPPNERETIALFNEESPLAPRYQFSEKQIIQDTTVQELIFDESLLYLAQKFLQSKPILDGVTMWWSAPHNPQAASEAAQMFHFDMDRFKFIKFFFYLTDVDTSTGPHVYVAGSQKKLPPSLFQDRRFTDSEIERHYKSDEIRELNGHRGTIMAVDTSGLHKGKVLESKHRLLFQIEFANSLFGQAYSNHSLNLAPHLKGRVEKYRDTFQLFTDRRIS